MGRKKGPREASDQIEKALYKTVNYMGWFVLFISLTERSRERIRVRAWEKIQDDNFSLQTSGVW